MFERNKIDAGTLQQMTVAADVGLEDGRTLKGKFIMSAARGFFDVLNGPGLFLEFEPYAEERIFIAKASIRSIKMINAPVPQGLNSRPKEIDTFDPYKVLGLEQGAAWDDIRAAYHRLAKAYHPDRYAGVDLPAEVREYVQAMARRVNAAYDALEGPHQVVKAAASNRAEAVYTSRPRA